MPMLQQYLLKEEKAKESISTAQFFRRLGLLVEEPHARKILISYLDSQNFYKVSPDVLFLERDWRILFYF